MNPDVTLGAPDTDAAVEEIIKACLDPNSPRSFFLYAGAGSGKTSSLVEALKAFRAKYGNRFRRYDKKIAIITYTNAAANEIADRMYQDPVFLVRTIHSFCWSQINTFHSDIRNWLLGKLPHDLADLREKQAKGRPGQAMLDRERKIEEIGKRIERLKVPRKFTYSPNGDNYGADSLSHSEVIKITSDFIENRPGMQALLIHRFPFILIDESQDTNKDLIDAVFALAAANKGRFALGLFGDMMQRIYADGHPDLGRNIPADWARPVKRMNHRSPQRVVQLGNALRADVDSQRQWARSDSQVGKVRLFIAPADAPDKPSIEVKVRAVMASACEDQAWLDAAEVKTLTLEHKMAAERRGFLPMFKALDVRGLSTGLRNGEIAGLRLFTERVAPLLSAHGQGDRFGVMALLRANSPTLRLSALADSQCPDDPLGEIRGAVEELASIGARVTTRFLDVLECVAKHKLFEIPESLRSFVGSDIDDVTEESNPFEAGSGSAAGLEQAWRAFLETPYHQIIPYAEYVEDKGPYGTHQGVKGLEFDRVMVVMDDSEAGGFLFSYERLFGVKSPSDRRNAPEGTETSIDRTRRLLYVTCTRARRSLALVAYTENPKLLASSVLEQGWFAVEELVPII